MRTRMIKTGAYVALCVSALATISINCESVEGASGGASGAPTGTTCDNVVYPNPCGDSPGSKCNSDAECATNHCAYGVCCDSACDTPCSLCTGGYCQLAGAPEGTDAHGDCSGQIAGCATAGACDGNGFCADYVVLEPGSPLVAADGSSLGTNTREMAARPGRVVATVLVKDDIHPYEGTRVYVFDQKGTEWSEVGLFDVTVPGNDPTGQTVVAAAAEVVVIGFVGGIYSGKVLIKERQGDQWISQSLTESGDKTFGSSVSTDGQTVAIGSPYNGGGVVRVYAKSGGQWNLQKELYAPDAGPDAHFGESVSLDGTNLLVGAPQAGPGPAYMFQYTGGSWSLKDKLPAPSGAGHAFGAPAVLSGNVAFLRSFLGKDAGHRIHVFTFTGGSWVHTTDLQPFGVVNTDNGYHLYFGDRMAFASDTLFVGGFHQAFAFAHVGTDWVPRAKIAWPYGFAGVAVALAGDVTFVDGTWLDTLCPAP